MADRERQRAEKEKEREFELKKMELEIRRDNPNLSNSTFLNAPGTDSFDATKHIRLVPRFQEREVDKYFQHFEKIAASLNWPKDKWTLLLQSVLIGKARDIFTAMDLEQSVDYDVVKEAILKAYELVPEAYRQKFRNARKLHDQTHVEFARYEEQLFDRWLTSSKVEGSYDNMKQLMLIEQLDRKSVV